MQRLDYDYTRLDDACIGADDARNGQPLTGGDTVFMVLLSTYYLLLTTYYLLLTTYYLPLTTYYLLLTTYLLLAVPLIQASTFPGGDSVREVGSHMRGMGEVWVHSLGKSRLQLVMHAAGVSDSPHVLLTSATLVPRVQVEVEAQLQSVPRLPRPLAC